MLALILLLLACPSTEPVEPTPTENYDTLAVAETLADQAWDRWEPSDLSFDWSQSVLAWGIQRAWAASGTQRHQDFYATWLDAGLAERFDQPDAQPFRSSDSMSPSILASLAQSEGTGDYGPILSAAEVYLAEARRTSGEAIVHWGPEHPFGTNRQVWVDSMFMIGMYLLAEGDRLDDPSYAARWLTQADGTASHCFTDDDLYLHAWDDDESVNIPDEPTYWARGNAWVLVSGAEYARRGHDWAPFARHAAALADLQQPSGRWLTVLNGPSDDGLNYEETSSTALIAYGLHLGMEAGALDAATYGPVLSRAIDGLQETIGVLDNGHHLLEGTSMGTNPGDYAYYVGIPTLDDQLVGVGAAIAALSEVHGAERIR